MPTWSSQDPDRMDADMRAADERRCVRIVYERGRPTRCRQEAHALSPDGYCRVHMRHGPYPFRAVLMPDPGGRAPAVVTVERSGR